MAKIVLRVSEVQGGDAGGLVPPAPDSPLVTEAKDGIPEVRDYRYRPGLRYHLTVDATLEGDPLNPPREGRQGFVAATDAEFHQRHAPTVGAIAEFHATVEAAARKLFGAT